MPNIIELTDFSASQLDIYARLTEAQLLHFYEPNGGLFIAESPKVIERALDAGYLPFCCCPECGCYTSNSLSNFASNSMISLIVPPFKL